MQMNRRGQFQKGNPGGPGRPKKQPTYTELVLSIMPPEKWQSIFTLYTEKAAHGDLQAAYFVATVIGAIHPQFTGLSAA